MVVGSRVVGSVVRALRIALIIIRFKGSNYILEYGLKKKLKNQEVVNYLFLLVGLLYIRKLDLLFSK